MGLYLELISRGAKETAEAESSTSSGCKHKENSVDVSPWVSCPHTATC